MKKNFKKSPARISLPEMLKQLEQDEKKYSQMMREMRIEK